MCQIPPVTPSPGRCFLIPSVLLSAVFFFHAVSRYGEINKISPWKRIIPFMKYSIFLEKSFRLCIKLRRTSRGKERYSGCQYSGVDVSAFSSEKKICLFQRAICPYREQRDLLKTLINLKGFVGTLFPTEFCQL